MVQKETLENLERKGLRGPKALWGHQDQLENEDTLVTKED